MRKLPNGLTLDERRFARQIEKLAQADTLDLARLLNAAEDDWSRALILSEICNRLGLNDAEAIGAASLYGFIMPTEEGEEI